MQKLPLNVLAMSFATDVFAIFKLVLPIFEFIKKERYNSFVLFALLSLTELMFKLEKSSFQSFLNI